MSRAAFIWSRVAYALVALLVGFYLAVTVPSPWDIPSCVVAGVVIGLAVTRFTRWLNRPDPE